MLTMRSVIYQLLLTMLLLTPTLATAKLSPPEEAALKFNRWYIKQLMDDKLPMNNYDKLAKYVATDTINALKSLYDADDDGNKDYPDADMFIKAQDFGDDWNKITIVDGDYDPVCTHVYIAFGQKKDHIVADCMVQDDAGNWKVRSVTLIEDR